MTTTQPEINRRVAPVTQLNKRASFAYINGIAIVISDVEKWSDSLVLEFIEEQATLADNKSAIANITHFFGDIFGASHRKLIVEWIEKKGLSPSPRTALVTNSAIMRAALTAYSWLTKTEAKAFEPNDKEAMCQWVTQGTGVNPAEIKTALETCYKLIGK